MNSTNKYFNILVNRLNKYYDLIISKRLSDFPINKCTLYQKKRDVQAEVANLMTLLTD